MSMPRCFASRCRLGHTSGREKQRSCSERHQRSAKLIGTHGSVRSTQLQALETSGVCTMKE